MSYDVDRIFFAVVVEVVLYQKFLALKYRPGRDLLRIVNPEKEIAPTRTEQPRKSGRMNCFRGVQNCCVKNETRRPHNRTYIQSNRSIIWCISRRVHCILDARPTLARPANRRADVQVAKMTPNIAWMRAIGGWVGETVGSLI